MPFIKTALLGGAGASVLPPGDVVNHFNQIRVRVTGAGTLKGILYSMDDISSEAMTNMIMSSINGDIMRSLMNFTQERASLKLYTDQIDEVFSITRIVIYARPVAVEYPA